MRVLKSMLVAGFAASLLLAGCAGAKTAKPEAAAKLPEVTLPANSARMTPIVQAAKKVGPAVVGISNKSVVKVRDFFFNRIFEKEQEGFGSGVIYKADGYIVTNHHVVENAKELMVYLADGRTASAKMIGSDSITDLAVIKIDLKDLPTAEFGDSDTLMVGEPAIAIGNPMGLEFRGSVTAGVVSALNRHVQIGESDVALVQTDAAISPGNSGGALVNADGEVIGINSRKIVTNGAEGLGFAIPANTVKHIVADLEKGGKVKRPYLGVYLMDKEQLKQTQLDIDMKDGVLIAKIAPDSAVAKAGLKPMDIITKLNGQKVSNSAELRSKLFEHSVGETVTLTVLVRGEEKEFKVTLQERPKDDKK